MVREFVRRIAAPLRLLGVGGLLALGAPELGAQDPVAQEPATESPATQDPATQDPATQNPAPPDDLAARISALESEAETARAERELLLRALDLTTDKLDGFLQRVVNLSRAEPEPRPADPATPPAAAGTPWWAIWMPIILAVLATAWLWGRWHRRNLRRDHQDSLLMEEQDAIESGADPLLDPPLVLDEAPMDDFPEPHVVSQDLAAERPDVLRESVARWLAEDPRVLVTPPPVISIDAAGLQVRYHLLPGLHVEDAARVEAEVAGLAHEMDLDVPHDVPHDAPPATAYSASASTPAPAFPEGNGGEQGYTPGPSKPPRSTNL